MMTRVWLEGLLYDLRFAVRGLRRDRLFTLTVIAMLTLAIGLNVTVFTVVSAMLFRGLPLVKRSDRVVYIDVRKPLSQGACAGPVRGFRGVALAESRVFRDGVQGGGRRDDLPQRQWPVDMNIQRVSANTFALLGVRPMLGRDFTPADEIPGAAPVAIVSYRPRRTSRSSRDTENRS